MTLDDVLSLADAAEMFGRTPSSFRKAVERGSLEARLVAPRCYVTTRDHAAAYVARVAAQRPLRRTHPRRDRIR